MSVCAPLSLADVVYVHNDALGSPIMESDANGDIISKSHYKPFGETLEAMQDGVGYTGHLNDADLGLTYMQARYYDPVIGRFYSNDPIGFRDVHSFNRYAYANNNPYKYIDPDGKDASLYEKPAKTADPSDLKKEKKKQEIKFEMTNEVETHEEADKIESSSETIVGIVQAVLTPIASVLAPEVAIPVAIINALLIVNPITPAVHKGDKITVNVELTGSGMSLTDSVTSTTNTEHNHGN